MFLTIIESQKYSTINTRHYIVLVPINIYSNLLLPQIVPLRVHIGAVCKTMWDAILVQIRAEGARVKANMIGFLQTSSAKFSREPAKIRLPGQIGTPLPILRSAFY